MNNQTKINFKISKNDKNNFSIKKNNTIVKTPMGNTLEVPSLELAKSILEEYKLHNKKSYSNLVSPIKITNTAIDKIKLDCESYLINLSESAHKDVVCYFAKNPDDLVNKQNKLWMPLIKYMKEEYNINIVYTSDISGIKQKKKCLIFIKKILTNFNIYELAAIYVLSQLTNSIIIPLALVNGKISVKKAFESSYLEEIYQANLWGKDEEAFIRLNAISLDIKNVKNYYDLASK